MADRDQTATVDLKVRMKEPLRERIEAAARTRGVSMNAEAVARLEESFRDESLLPQILNIAYGRETAGLLLLIGECLRDTTAHSAAFAGAKLEANAAWMDRPWVYRQVKDAIGTILEELEPPGTSDAPTPELIEGMAEPLRHTMKNLGRGFAIGAIAALFGDPESAGHLIQRLSPARDRLASVINARKTEDVA